jgi:hypothetical protein
MDEISHHVIVVKLPPKERSWTRIGEALSKALPEGHIPVRVIAVKADRDRLWFEASTVKTKKKPVWGSLLKPNPAVGRHRGRFVVASIIPTGVRAEFGGFCGDGVPVTNLLAEAADMVITNPNATTASDLYHAGEKVRVMEGNLLCHFLLGNINLADMRPREIGVIIGKPKEEIYLNNVVNAINAMRTVSGLPIHNVLVSRKGFDISCVYSDFGHATGEYTDLAPLFEGLDRLAPKCEAIAISSEMLVSDAIRTRYYTENDLPNPWGGGEACLTHTATTLYPMPVTHAPLLGNLDNAMLGTKGDPRDASELISSSYICSVLQGLHRSPRPLKRSATDKALDPTLIATEDLAALVLPATAVGGLPFFTALERGIPVILVEANKTQVGLSAADVGLADHPGITRVSSYAEAAGVLLAMKAGIAYDTIVRPVEVVEAEAYGELEVVAYG